MNKIHVTYKNLLLPITFIAATLISACDNDKDAMAEAEKIKRNTCKNPAKEHQQSMFFTTKPKCKSYCQYQRKGGANLAIIEVRFFKGGYSFIRQSVNTPAKVEVFKFNNGYWGPSPVNLTIFGTITEEQNKKH